MEFDKLLNFWCEKKNVFLIVTYIFWWIFHLTLLHARWHFLVLIFSRVLQNAKCFVFAFFLFFLFLLACQTYSLFVLSSLESTPQEGFKDRAAYFAVHRDNIMSVLVFFWLKYKISHDFNLTLKWGKKKQKFLFFDNIFPLIGLYLLAESGETYFHREKNFMLVGVVAWVSNNRIVSFRISSVNCVYELSRIIVKFSILIILFPNLIVLMELNWDIDFYVYRWMNKQIVICCGRWGRRVV